MFEQIQVGNVSDTLGRNGQVISPSHMNDERNYPITVGRTTQVWNIAMDATPDSGDIYNVHVLGETATLTVDAEDQEEAVDALVAAINANPIIRGVFTATNVSNTTVRLTANSSGTDIEVTISGTGAADLMLSGGTAGAAATQIPIGRAMYVDGSNGVTVTNPDLTNLDAFAGFTRLLLEEEQTGVASATATTDLYEDNEDVCVLKRGRMLVDTGASADENGAIYIEQAAGATLGKAYSSGDATATVLTLTPDGAPSTGDVFTVTLNIDGEIVVAEFVTGATETVKAAVEAIVAALAAATAVTLLTATEDDSVVDIDITDPNATVTFVLSDNLAGVLATDGTRLLLPRSKGAWAGPNKIDLKGGF
jgi:hypothetical protein